MEELCRELVAIVESVLLGALKSKMIDSYLN